jgi:hypothetical protein
MLETLLIVVLIVVLVSLLVKFLPIDEHGKDIVWVVLVILLILWLVRGGELL